MNVSPRIDTAGEPVFVVEPSHTIDFADDRMPAVPCTPWLIGFLEFEAHDQHEVIGRGYHRLRVIDADRFAKRVGTKAAPP